MTTKRKKKATGPKSGARTKAKKGKMKRAKRAVASTKKPSKLAKTARPNKSAKHTKLAQPRKAKPIQAKKAGAAVKPAPASKQGSASGKPKIAAKLLEVLEKRKRTATPMELFSKPSPPPTRRGRRPKNGADYTASSDEDVNSAERTPEKMHYDTGIKPSYSVDGDSLTFERSDDFEEELNFDS